jgi:threonine dehydrogenase-like Zn-dependent dehydrogenase
MEALVYTRPMNVEVRELDTPQLRDCDVLVRVRACGACGSDLAAISSMDSGQPSLKSSPAGSHRF